MICSAGRRRGKTEERDWKRPRFLLLQAVIHGIFACVPRRPTKVVEQKRYLKSVCYVLVPQIHKFHTILYRLVVLGETEQNPKGLQADFEGVGTNGLARLFM